MGLSSCPMKKTLSLLFLTLVGASDTTARQAPQLRPRHARRLSGDDDEGLWAPIPGGNYSSWDGRFGERIAHSCHLKEANFEFESGKYVKSRSGPLEVFEGLDDIDRVLTLEECLPDEELGPYIGEHVGMMIFIFIGILGIVLAISCAFGLTTCCRNCWSGCCGKCNNCWTGGALGQCCSDKERTYSTLFRYKEGEKGENGNQTFWIRLIVTGIFVTISVIFLIVFGALLIAYTVKGTKSNDAALCDGWQGLRGHYFGAQDMTGLPEGVVPTWKGTHAQYEEMSYLAYRTKPSEPGNPAYENPIYTEVYEGYLEIEEFLLTEFATNYDLAETLKASCLEIDAALQQALLDHNAALPTAPPGGVPVPPFRMLIPLRNAGIEKSGEYQKKLNMTTFEGLEIMRANIDANLKEDSLILAEGYRSAVLALTSLEDVDYVIAHLAGDIDTLQNNLVDPLMLLTRILLIVQGCGAIIAGILTAVVFVYVGLKLVNHETERGRETEHPLYENDFIVKHFFKPQYILIMLLGAGCLLSVGIFGLVGRAGADVCFFVNDALFDRGDWYTLPSSMWNITATNSTDILTILDTCVKEGGDGDIAAHLGLVSGVNDLDKSVTLLADTLVKEVEDMELDYRLHEIKVLRDLMNDVAIYWRQDRDPTVLDWPDHTRYVHPDVVEPYLNDLRMMNLIMVFGAVTGEDYANMIIQTAKDGVAQTQGLGYLNSFIRDFARSPDTPTSADDNYWCFFSTINPELGVDCDPQPIDPTTHDYFTCETTLLQDKIDASVAAAEAAANAGGLSGKFDAVRDGEKFTNAIIHACHLENLMHVPVDTAAYEVLTCPDGGQVCTLNEVRRTYRNWVHEQLDILEASLHLSKDNVNKFVHGLVIGIMDDLLDQAYSALGDFNCQYVGTSVKEATVHGLCEISFPELTMIGRAAIFVAIAALILAVIFWKMWHHLTLFQEDQSKPKEDNPEEGEYRKPDDPTAVGEN